MMRHPTYFNYVAVTLFLFLATGIWIVLFGALGWVAAPRQARAEEEALEKRFGRIYTAYAARTGRFFPRI